jgi:DNA-binding NarL/FixJ family response regulator
MLRPPSPFPARSPQCRNLRPASVLTELQSAIELASGRSPSRLCHSYTTYQNRLLTLRAERHSTPTLIVSARDDMKDIVHGLDMGADDYLTKPFALDILLARVWALSRRLSPDLMQAARRWPLGLSP